MESNAGVVQAVVEPVTMSATFEATMPPLDGAVDRVMVRFDVALMWRFYTFCHHHHCQQDCRSLCAFDVHNQFLLNSFHGHWTNRGVEPFGTDGCGWNSGDLGYNIVPHLRPDETTCSTIIQVLDGDLLAFVLLARNATVQQEL